MRVWDVPERYLCRQHLLGQHREIHAIWHVIFDKRKGYSRHPEVLRWAGRLDALKDRHDGTVDEMTRRGYQHHSPVTSVGDSTVQDLFLCSVQDQAKLLLAKGCACEVKEKS